MGFYKGAAIGFVIAALISLIFGYYKYEIGRAHV